MKFKFFASIVKFLLQFIIFTFFYYFLIKFSPDSQTLTLIPLNIFSYNIASNSSLSYFQSFYIPHNFSTQTSPHSTPSLHNKHSPHSEHLHTHFRIGKGELNSHLAPMLKKKDMNGYLWMENVKLDGGKFSFFFNG